MLKYGLLVAAIIGVFSMNANSGEVFWVDVRSDEEFADWHHPSSVNIPHGEIDQRITEVTTNKDSDIRVYCRSGRRSEIAKTVLDKMGYSNVTNEGGLEEVTALVDKVPK